MSIDEYKKHIVFQTIEHTRNKTQVLSQDYKDLIEMILATITYLEIRVNNTNPIFLTDDILNSINKEFSNINTYIDQFLNQKNTSYLSSIKNSIKSILMSLNNSLPFLIDTLKDSNISSFFEDLKLIFDRAKKDLEQHYENNINTLNKKNQELVDKNQKNEQKINELTTLLSKKENQFNTELQNIQNRFNQYQVDLNSKFNNLLREIEQKIDSYIKDTQSKIDTNIKLINQKKEEALKIVNVISNIGVTGNYQKNADSHRKQANCFRIIAILFMLASIFWLGFTLIGMSKNSYDWHISLIRILATIIFIYPAQYAARESSEHRRLENIYRKMELDLATINPFIELLDEQTKKQIKEKLVDRYFNINVEVLKEDNIPVSLLDKIFSQISNLVKSLNKS